MCSFWGLLSQQTDGSEYGNIRTSRRFGSSLDAQSSLPHQGKNTLTKELEIRQEIVEVHLNAVTARFLETEKPINNLLRRANEMNITHCSRVACFQED